MFDSTLDHHHATATLLSSVASYVVLSMYSKYLLSDTSTTTAGRGKGGDRGRGSRCNRVAQSQQDPFGSIHSPSILESCLHQVHTDGTCLWGLCCARVELRPDRLGGYHGQKSARAHDPCPDHGRGNAPDVMSLGFFTKNTRTKLERLGKCGLMPMAMTVLSIYDS